MNLNSIKVRCSYFGAGPVLVACLFALTLTATVWPLLSCVHEKYPDPVAGDITMKNLIKSMDMHALMLLVGSAAVFALAITVLARSTVPVEKESELQTVNQLLLFSLLPAVFRLAAACFNDSRKLPPLLYVSLFPAAAIAVLVMLWRYRKQLSSDDFFVIGGAALLSPLMAGFSALALILTTGRLVPNSAGGLTPIVYPITGAVVAAAALALLLIWILSPTIELLRKRMLGLLMGCQYPLPLLLFYLVPPPLVDPAKQFRTTYPTALVIVLGLLVLLGAYGMVRRFYSAKIEPDRPLVKAISPVSVACLMVFLLCGTATLPSPWHDFWDSGELLVPWQQVWDFHSLPFVNFCPIHGLMEITYGALNQMFFGGTASNESCAETLVAGFGVALTALTACELLSPLTALFFLFGLMPFADRFYFVAPTLFLIASPRLLPRPALWLAVWIVISVLATVYNPALGPAFVIGTVPVALWQIWRAIRNARSQFAVLVLCVGVAGAVVFLIHPLRQIAFGFLHFILDNAWTNDAANGIAWSTGAWLRDRTTGIGSIQFLWEFARSGWIIVSLGAMVLCWKQFSKPAAQRSIPAIALAISAALTMLCSSVYTLGQIDPANLSRIGCMSEVAFFFLTPALLFLVVPKRQQALCALVLATGLGLVYPWQHSSADPQIDPTPILQKACAVRTIPPGTPSVDGSRIGLPRLGQIIRANPDWTQDLLKLKGDLSVLLKPVKPFSISPIRPRFTITSICNRPANTLHGSPPIRACRAR